MTLTIIRFCYEKTITRRQHGEEYATTTMSMSRVTTSAMMMPATTTLPLRLGTLERLMVYQVGARGELTWIEGSFRNELLTVLNRHYWRIILIY